MLPILRRGFIFLPSFLRRGWGWFSFRGFLANLESENPLTPFPKGDHLIFLPLVRRGEKTFVTGWK